MLQARQKLKGDDADAGELGAEGEQEEPEGAAEREYEFDPERVVTRSAGRRGWLRDADRQ